MYLDDGTPKSLQNSAMYADAYARLALKKVQRTTFAAQLEHLGEVVVPFFQLYNT